MNFIVCYEWKWVTQDKRNRLFNYDIIRHSIRLSQIVWYYLLNSKLRFDIEIVLDVGVLGYGVILLKHWQ